LRCIERRTPATRCEYSYTCGVIVAPPHVQHLVKRFVGSLSSKPPAVSDQEWLLSLLNPCEVALFSAMSAPDRRHAVECALAARDLLGSNATDVLIVASALHDVGKTEADLGTFGRVAATLLARAFPVGRIQAYGHHPLLGAERLTAAGSAPEVVAWAREHHLPVERWTLPEAVGRALAEADGEPVTNSSGPSPA